MVNRKAQFSESRGSNKRSYLLFSNLISKGKLICNKDLEEKNEDVILEFLTAKDLLCIYRYVTKTLGK